MTRLMNESEFRYNLRKSFDAGYEFCRLMEAGDDWDSMDFDEWYDEVYGGPDCE